jgi:hypothetical protein
MPKGPKDEKRPANVIGNAIKVAKIATGEIEDGLDQVVPIPAGVSMDVSFES